MEFKGVRGQNPFCIGELIAYHAQSVAMKVMILEGTEKSGQIEQRNNDTQYDY